LMAREPNGWRKRKSPPEAEGSYGTRRLDDIPGGVEPDNSCRADKEGRTGLGELKNSGSEMVLRATRGEGGKLAKKKPGGGKVTLGSVTPNLSTQYVSGKGGTKNELRNLATGGRRDTTSKRRN